jgi:hypothetical protein
VKTADLISSIQNDEENMKAAEVNIIFTSDGPIRPYQPKYESTRIWVKKDGHLYVYIPKSLQNYMHLELDDNGRLICISRDKASFRMKNGRLEVMT